MLRGQIDEAIVLFRRALGLTPAMVAIRVNLARALRTREDFAEAIEQFRLCLRARPADAGLHFQLGLTLESNGQLT